MIFKKKPSGDIPKGVLIINQFVIKELINQNYN